MYWTHKIDPIDRARGCRIVSLKDGQPISYAEALERWQHDADFRAAFIEMLADAPFGAFFWETPPATASTVSRTFECVLVDSPALARAATDRLAFQEQFREAGSAADVVAFANLGGDAFLVAPCPIGPETDYPHLAAFARAADMDQQHAFWRTVGASMAERVSDRPLWLSTSGLGVAWLHVRLDTRPKYYTHRPYRMMA